MISSDGVVDAVGKTPLIYIKSLSEATGCKIYAKAEFMNPGGSIKDRTAKGLILDAEREGKIKPGDTIVEGTAGNTGIGICLVAAAKGYKTVMYVPDNQSAEKISVLRTLGAEVLVVPAVPFSNPNHFYHQAKRRGMEVPNTYFPDQFENTSNYNIHYTTTGPEIWEQTNHAVDYFVVSAGTGGTIAGVSSYLKEQNSNIKVYLADPPGSGLFNHIIHGKMEADGRKTITQGIGIIRETANFSKAKVDGAIVGENREVIEMLHYLLKKEGLFLGSTAGINCVGALRVAQKFGPGKTIVTVFPDGGQRYISGLFNEEYLKSIDLVPMATGLEFLPRDDSKVVERQNNNKS